MVVKVFNGGDYDCGVTEFIIALPFYVVNQLSISLPPKNEQ